MPTGTHRLTGSPAAREAASTQTKDAASREPAQIDIRTTEESCAN